MQGRKVRVTCKHCGFGIIIDGTSLAAPLPPPPPPKLQPLETVPAIFDALRVADDDATRVIRKLQDYSVHDEPTVIGRIPQEALDAERRFAQRTVPPPRDASSPASPTSVPASDGVPSLRDVPSSEDVPSLRELPPQTDVPPLRGEGDLDAPAPGTIPPVSPAVFWSEARAKPVDPTNAATPLAIRQSRSTLESGDSDAWMSGRQSLRPARWPWLVAALLVLTAAFLLSRAR